ncbi:hypothetical protein COL93_21095 [Bacillus toyonensis]|uniref:Uncharacterized protein n=1 Tax=Bacillus toyonensis TaxID=155322 RepID=A0A2C4R1T6_9BACI|nr:hypothetical protein COL93_21095 [Bacillus toyonensis]PHD70652.1 hypothetical protein COF40_10705 [Bacillus toyonensis]
MKCLYCDCKIDIINQTYKGLVTGWIPEFYIDGNKIRKNRYNEKLVCIDCIDIHNEELDKF